ncbi:hypothetical protein LSAT2_024903 [Lamellibrachia satsuma]|nr:hypothetical protein LSAT2_024903 [Lamellibrachia satsuma]
MERLEPQAILTAPITCKPKLWKIYVDDVMEVRGTSLNVFGCTKKRLNAIMDEKFSVGRSGVVLLLLLAIFCCQIPDTTCSQPPKFLLFYIWCIEPCANEFNSCVAHCQENNTCEASRNFCKDLCLKAANICETKCRDEAERQRIMNNE